MEKVWIVSVMKSSFTHLDIRFCRLSGSDTMSNFFNSPVDKLVDDDNVTWLNLLPERTACRGNQQMSTALFSHRPDVGLVVHIGWHYSVLPPMPEDGKKNNNKISIQNVCCFH